MKFNLSFNLKIMSGCIYYNLIWFRKSIAIFQKNQTSVNKVTNRCFLWIIVTFKGTGMAPGRDERCDREKTT